MYSKKASTRTVLTAAIGALVVGAGLSACGQANTAPNDRVEVLELAIENDQFAGPDQTPAVAKLGDLSAYSGWMLKDGRRVGQGGGSCQVVRIEGDKSTMQCVLTIKLEQGSLTMQALQTANESPLDMAITGGTGAYRDARGTARWWDVATPKERVRAEITHGR
ncbi:dirigent protein [Nocardia arthritidis]|uniref:Allene oxide cyclase barrel-like domain-containing protein n=1 Tax=Nocardia arthritidis TaxID=228602 RepID=A0A6G9YEC1_9NOCA|nr:dirigent protein [Nocardia arthritidis]QIS11514.1 hypothetical protein F5544_18200 [Nocardia arthritidis]